MPRDPRPYVTYPVGYTGHPRIDLLSDAAFRLFHQMNDHSRVYGLDGLFSRELVKRKKWPKKALDELVRGIDDRPLVVIVDGGYFLRSYEEHQFTTADIQAMKERKARAGAAGGRAKAAARQNAGEAVASASPEGWQNVAESKSKSKLEDKTDRTHDSEVRHVIPARAEQTDWEFLAESASNLGIKRLNRVIRAFEPVVGPIEGVDAAAIAVDVAGAVLNLSTGHVRYPEAYLEQTAKDSPDTIRDEWSRVAANAPKAVIA